METSTSPSVPASKFCFACGRTLDARAEICPACGVRQTMGPADANRESAGVEPSSASVPGALVAIVASIGWGVALWSSSSVTSALDQVVDIAAYVLPICLVAALHLGGVIGRRVAAGFMLGAGSLLAIPFLVAAGRLAVEGQSLDGANWWLAIAGLAIIGAGLLTVQRAKSYPTTQ